MIDRTLIAYARPYRKGLILTSLLMLAASTATLSLPWLGGKFAATVISEQNEGIGILLLSLLIIFTVQASLVFTSNYLAGRIAYGITTDLRKRIFDHLQRLPLSFFHERRRGDVLALMTHDAIRLSNFLSGSLPSIFPMLVTLTGSLILMFALQPILAAVVALLVPAFYLILKIVGRELRPLAAQIREEEAQLTAMAEENLAMLPAIKAFAREPFESDRFHRKSAQALKLAISQHKIYAAIGPLIQFISAIAVVLLLWLATSAPLGSELEPSELVSFLLYAAVLTRPVSTLANLYGQIQTARGALTSLDSVLAEPRERIDEFGRTLEGITGEIKFDDVSFSYPDRPPALDHASFEIKAGETVAIVGPNGAGKSTLVHLLMRLHEPQSGRIFIDGVNVAETNLRSLRQQIGLVSQNVLLFNATVAQNIAIGKEGASQWEIEEAARAAQAHEFITRLPQGYETVIGDSGVRLSGGQRQRIALGRALIKSPRILVLDEATAMFDLEGERSFVAQSRSTLKGRTVILITHRPASLALADRIVRLENGHFVSDSFEHCSSIRAASFG